jgi:hypothetical protein
LNLIQSRAHQLIPFEATPAVEFVCDYISLDGTGYYRVNHVGISTKKHFLLTPFLQTLM